MKKLYASFILVCAMVSATAQYNTSLTRNATVTTTPIAGGTEFRLTTNLPIEQAGSVWKTAQVNLNANFTINASLNFGQWTETNVDPNKIAAYNSGADGIAFVLAPVPYIGGVGEEVGYGTTYPPPGPPQPTGYFPNNSLAIEMDTWRNTTTGFSGAEGYRNHNENDGNHIAIMSKGQSIHGTPEQLLGPTAVGGDLEDNQWHNVTISWVAATRTLSLNSTSGFAINASASLTPAQMTSIFGAGVTMVNFGFTAGTGSAGNLQRVRIFDAPDCSAFTVTATVPALACSGGNVIYIGYGPQSITATSSDPAATFTWFRVGTPDVQVGTGATFTPTQSGTYYVVATNGVCTASTKGAATQITVIDIRCGKDGQDKVNVCHKKNGEHGNGTIGDNAHTLCVSVNAVPAHLAHGDCLGSCDDAAGKRAPVTASGETEVEENGASIYPNPSRGRVQLNLGKSTRSEIQVMNARGAVVERRNASGAQNLSFDLNKYGKGLYLVKIITDGKVQTLKVMVQE